MIYKLPTKICYRVYFYLLFFCFLLLFNQRASAFNSCYLGKDTTIISGKVQSLDKKNPLAGVTIYVKSIGKNYMSAPDGTFHIEVPSDKNKVLLFFSMAGYIDTSVVIENEEKKINVFMRENSSVLQDVVVTALGIKREARSLGYSVGVLKSDDINKVAQENSLNSMSGKIPGVEVNSTGGIGSTVSVIIRGAVSLSNDNQPLFVIDGVPMSNELNNIGGNGSDNMVDYGNSISNLNPDDIESITVLKGPSAAALYGSRAGNGVVLITTKSGTGINKTSVHLTSNNVIENPYKFIPIQTRFATGVIPYTPETAPAGVLTIDEGSTEGLGPELDKGYNAIQWNSPVDDDGSQTATPLVSYKNNAKNFVQNGVTSINTVSVANSNAKATYRISYSNMINKGIIPGSDLYRNSLDFNSTLKITDKFKLSTVLNISRNNSDNRPAGDRGTNPLEWVYYLSPHINILDLKDYWEPGEEQIQQKSQDISTYNNPYFLAYAVNNSFVRDRATGNIRGDWQIAKNFSFMFRYALDLYHENRQTIIPYSYTEDPNGDYGITNLSNYEQNIDFLGSYKKQVHQFNFEVSFGGNDRYQHYEKVFDGTISGTGLTTPGLYTLSNIAPSSLSYSSMLSKKEVYSFYGIANIGYRDAVYLDITGRNDWSSTLPISNRSYFYPSASLSIILNSLLKLPAYINELKLRGGIAKSGNDADPYKLVNILGNLSSWGNVTRLNSSSTLLTPNLKPESLTAYEEGFDLAMVDNRIRLSATYYVTDDRNQIIPLNLPSSTGYTSENINAGLLRSRGLELSLALTPIKNKNLKWDMNINWAKNRTKVVELAPGVKYYQFWSQANAVSRVYVGDNIGNIYGPELVTVTDKSSPYYGYPLLDDQGNWQSLSVNNNPVKIGNFNPDFSIGIQSTISYKKFSLSFSVDWHKGGQFISQTYRYLGSDLRTKQFYNYVINPGVKSGTDLRNFLINNNLVKITGNNFHIVGGPTQESGGYAYSINGANVYFGAFNPGVIAKYDDNGNVTGYTENLGGDGTKIIPLSDEYPWDFAQSSLFPADYIKLREISIGYTLNPEIAKKLKLASIGVSIYSRNIILWTKAKINIDPERAFQPGSSGFRQGVERYNVTPWSLPIGIQLNIGF